MFCIICHTIFILIFCPYCIHIIALSLHCDTSNKFGFDSLVLRHRFNLIQRFQAPSDKYRLLLFKRMVFIVLLIIQPAIHMRCARDKFRLCSHHMIVSTSHNILTIMILNMNRIFRKIRLAIAIRIDCPYSIECNRMCWHRIIIRSNDLFDQFRIGFCIKNLINLCRAPSCKDHTLFWQIRRIRNLYQFPFMIIV